MAFVIMTILEMHGRLASFSSQCVRIGRPANGRRGLGMVDSGLKKGQASMSRFRRVP